MYQREHFRCYINLCSARLVLIVLYTINASVLLEAGASSTPKNLVSASVPSESSNITTTSSSLFQNEYQYRQAASKSSPSVDRHKVSMSTFTDTSLEHHTQNDIINPGSLDYTTYPDSRTMTNVPDCRGRIKLNGTRGYITDGPGYYQTNLQCVWLIDSGLQNATMRIHIHQFNTECNYDFLYVFDGDSVYSPLVAALSGDMKDFNNALAEVRYEDSISSIDNDNLSNQNYSANTNSDTSSKNSATIQTYTESRPLELRTYSGKAFIYFHSDTAQSMHGFYMTYSVDSCPLDCSNRGVCDYKTSTCRCEPGFLGDGCQSILCPNNCTSQVHGVCDKLRSCICNKDYFGSDCSLRVDHQVWNKLIDSHNFNPPRAFHHSVVVDDVMWVIGGKTLALSNTNLGIFRHRKTTTILAYDLFNRTWLDYNLEGITGQDHLAELSGHSVTAHGNKIFIFGGMSMNGTISNTLSVFDTDTHQLTSISNQKVSKGSEEDFSAPLSVTGHSANIVDGFMYAFLGYNPLYGYLNFAQKFNIANNSWSIIEPKGSSVSGCIGHTSTFDPRGRLIYIYGGHNSLRSNKLYSFDPQTEMWLYLLSGPSPRYYHGAVIMNGLLMIIGGNSYNSSHRSDQCYQENHSVYDLSCSTIKSSSNDTRIPTVACGQKCWTTLEDITSGVLKRHGHSVVVRNDREIILYGGFNGVLMNDLRFMSIPSCDSFSSERECTKSRFGSNCDWNSLSSTCELRTASSTLGFDSGCSRSELKMLQSSCEARESCSDCLSTNFGCVWCGFISQCQYGKCKSISGKTVLYLNQCHRDELFTEVSTRNLTKEGSENDEPPNEMECKVDNCYLCQSKALCSWQNEICSYSPPNNLPSLLSSPASNQEDSVDQPTSLTRMSKNYTRMIQKFDPFNRFFMDAFTSSLISSSPYHTCEIPCFMRKSCNECTTTKCIWCSTTDQCIDSSAYFAYGAMGQCMHYVAHALKCPVASCVGIDTCEKCLSNPKCGWLNDISNTGKGKCKEGTSDGPSEELAANIQGHNVSALTNWYYASCPSCQCNGHSYCKPNSSQCMRPCQEYTEGPHCDRCIPGYFGNPINGGPCRPCRCNGHAQSCNRETGKCYCSTKGIIGHNCDRCDDKNYYIGDPSSPINGTCYYNLTTDYQYTFNMSKPDDHFYSDINFINVPLRKDSDIDFSISCSKPALVNISSGSSYRNRRQIHTGLDCGSFRLRFSHERHNLYDLNYSFFVHVYKFQTPFILQIAFSQHRTLYLPQFFFTFSSVFLFFFALSGLAWKLKHEYDLYTRRQRQFIELEQMASRPFSTILLEMNKPAQDHMFTDSKQRLKQSKEPTPISFEPCLGSNVGVLSVFVQLPGKPNLAIGSALVTLNEEPVCDSQKDELDSYKQSSSKES